jgi:hypothetical protein
MAAVSLLKGGIPMDQLQAAFSAVDFDFKNFLLIAAILAVGSILLGAIGRFVFGKRSTLNQSVSSAIGIIFIYAATIVLYSAGARFQNFIAPLPFVSFSGTQMSVFSFEGSHYTVVCTQVLSMIILAFLANLADAILPRGKRIWSWFLLRILSVILAMAAHLLVTWLFTRYLPEGLVTYSPTILLGLLILLLLVGSLKLIVGAVLTTVNPLIGAFYTFFFATIVGKALTKAILTAAILSGLVLAMNYLGCAAVSIAAAALIAYIPLLVVLFFVWYLVSRVF